MIIRCGAQRIIGPITYSVNPLFWYFFLKATRLHQGGRVEGRVLPYNPSSSLYRPIIIIITLFIITVNKAVIKLKKPNGKVSE